MNHLEKITLAMLRMSSWTEECRGEKVVRSWKSYLFEALNALEEKGMVKQFQNTKSLVITDVEEADRLLAIMTDALKGDAK